MNALIDDRLTPALLFLAGWSLRWGVLIAAAAVALAVWRPRRVAAGAWLRDSAKSLEMRPAA